MEKAKNFQDLKVWKKSHELVLSIYTVTKTFPGEEKFGLVSQMRRATISVAANIAEGFTKRGKKNKVNYYNIAQGSLQELRYYLLLAKDLKYIENNQRYLGAVDEIGRMLGGLINAVSNPTLTPNY